MKGLNDPETTIAPLATSSTSNATSIQSCATTSAFARLSSAGFASMTQSSAEEWCFGLTIDSFMKSPGSRPSTHATKRCFSQGHTGSDASVQAANTGQYSHTVSSQNVEVPVAPNCPAMACQYGMSWEGSVIQKNDHPKTKMAMQYRCCTARGSLFSASPQRYFSAMSSAP